MESLDLSDTIEDAIEKEKEKRRRKTLKEKSKEFKARKKKNIPIFVEIIKNLLKMRKELRRLKAFKKGIDTLFMENGVGIKIYKGNFDFERRGHVGCIIGRFCIPPFQVSIKSTAKKLAAADIDPEEFSQEVKRKLMEFMRGVENE